MNTIFEEFTEKPILLENGKLCKSEPFKCMGTYRFDKIGKQTVYCMTHSEAYTFPRYFGKKGLKHLHYMAGFPEHSLKVIKTLIDLGFDAKEQIKINNNEISPIDFTTKILKRLSIPKGYKEIENIWVRICGKKSGKPRKTEIYCIAKTIKGWEEAGSNVDTGRTIAIISHMLHKGLIKDTGVHAPEGVIPQEEFFRELGKRDMFVYLDGRKIN